MASILTQDFLASDSAIDVCVKAGRFSEAEARTMQIQLGEIEPDDHDSIHEITEQERVELWRLVDTTFQRAQNDLRVDRTMAMKCHMYGATPEEIQEALHSPDAMALPNLISEKKREHASLLGGHAV